MPHAYTLTRKYTFAGYTAPAMHMQELHQPHAQAAATHRDLEGALPGWLAPPARLQLQADRNAGPESTEHSRRHTKSFETGCQA
jgi:hypothetical protein